MEATIVSSCKIKNNAVWVNGIEMKVDKSSDPVLFLTDLYKHINLSYPKFFKMDSLCKLGVLAAELAIRNNSQFENYQKEKVAIIFSNHASSIETDRNHVKTIADKSQYFPSPAIFVYTLPNIVIGEIAIKHKLTGENAFFVTEKFDEKLMHTYVSLALQSNHTTAAICGWVNVDGNDFEAVVYCVEKTKFNQDKEGFNKLHHPEVIQQLYN
ncbi:MAG: 3-oxoacyl-ACP synthase [Bacteroidota bacterium]